MALIKKINHHDVEGVRFGKYNLADNSTAVMYKFRTSYLCEVQMTPFWCFSSTLLPAS